MDFTDATAATHPLATPHLSLHGSIALPLEWPVAHYGKLATAEEALQLVHSRQRVYIGGGSGEPLVLTQALVDRAPGAAFG